MVRFAIEEYTSDTSHLNELYKHLKKIKIFIKNQQLMKEVNGVYKYIKITLKKIISIIIK